MDNSITSLGSMGLQAGKLANITTRAAATANPTLTPEQAKLDARNKDVANSFESMFISEMLSHMNNGIEPDKNFGGGQGEDMFKSFLNEQYAKEISRRGGIGIAPAIENYLKAQQLHAQEVKQ
ncbi:rod-binding protein [Govanella unica]|uniref:Rod-binding protein n=1 Tax=Govanella unica TaxID=2975056 RepID=A0A9X3TWU7_9PROT|nr:rod-binding protein [Govania unica]MDA5193211.1 rod-binding protein [Govania unica]